MCDSLIRVILRNIILKEELINTTEDFLFDRVLVMYNYYISVFNGLAIKVKLSLQFHPLVLYLDQFLLAA